MPKIERVNNNLYKATVLLDSDSGEKGSFYILANDFDEALEVCHGEIAYDESLIQLVYIHKHIYKKAF